MRAFTLRSPMKKSLPTLHNFLMSSKDGVGPNDACAIPSPDAADILNAPPSLTHNPYSRLLLLLLLLLSASHSHLNPSPHSCAVNCLPSPPPTCTSYSSKSTSKKSSCCRHPQSTTLRPHISLIAVPFFFLPHIPTSTLPLALVSAVLEALP
jgi:hypothetical protein